MPNLMPRLVSALVSRPVLAATQSRQASAAIDEAGARERPAPINGARFFAKSTLDSSANSTHETILWIEPESFLALAKPGFSPAKLAKAEAALTTDGKFHSLPYLMLEPNPPDAFKISGHEGRHRIRALANRGADFIPVKFRFLGHGERPIPTDQRHLGPIISENGSTSLSLLLHHRHDLP